MKQPIGDVGRGVRRTTNRWVVGIAAVIAVCMLCSGGVTLALLDQLTIDTAANGQGCGDRRAVDPNGELPEVAELTRDQVRNAALIIRTGQDMNVVARGWVIGVATALQESRLTNLPHLGADNDHDSIGLFQQRPSQGWGTTDQLVDPSFQSRKFFEKLLRIPGWQTLPLTVAAQRVQVSAYPNAYAKHEPLAAQVVDALTGGASRAVGSELLLRCAAAGEIAASGWTVPIQGSITSDFRTSSRPGHNGVDIAVGKGTPVRAAAAGVVLVATCNAHVGSQSYSCDQDGSVSVKGCGWYVDILHAANVITRYCHLMSRPYVQTGQSIGAGQIIGLSGSSGHSSGPHLHFEVHLHADDSSYGAIDPVSFMNLVGAPLVGPA